MTAEAAQKYGDAKICLKCENFKVPGCRSGLCAVCYNAQARREESSVQNESVYWKELKNL